MCSSDLSYEIGTAYGHIAIGVLDIHATCGAIAERGGRIVRAPGPMKHGSTVIAFVEDPDGYRVELIQRSEASDGEPQRPASETARPASDPAIAS